MLVGKVFSRQSGIQVVLCRVLVVIYLMQLLAPGYNHYAGLTSKDETPHAKSKTSAQMGGCGIGLPVMFLALLAMTPTISEADDCADSACDYARVRAILDANGLTSTTVQSVTSWSNHRVVTLNLPNKGLTTIPDDIGSLKEMKTLSLNGNAGLTALPDTMRNLTKLEYYYIYSTKITSLPAVSAMTNLKYLWAFADSLTSLPDFSTSQTNLTDLRVQTNKKLSALPNSIGRLTGLTYLYANDCGLTSVPDGI
ncbi:MAG: leucine-rich repeat domain-containing protein, partial [Fibrobacterota bacterium]